MDFGFWILDYMEFTIPDLLAGWEMEVAGIWATEF